MPATVIAGSQFTISVNSTDYSAQVTEGTITRNTPNTRIKTLTDTAIKKTDSSVEVEITYLYDEETGFYGALDTAMGTGAALTVSIVGGDAKWTGSLYCDSNEVTFSADGVAEATASFTGSALTLADAP